MKSLVIGVAAAAVTVLGVPATAHARAMEGNGQQYYLALGDSLAAGIQPDAQGTIEPTDQGYPNQLDTLLQAFAPGIKLANLGCSGETTGTFTTGGVCDFQGAGSQLSSALDFLSGHAGLVRSSPSISVPPTSTRASPSGRCPR